MSDWVRRDMEWCGYGYTREYQQRYSDLPEGIRFEVRYMQRQGYSDRDIEAWVRSQMYQQRPNNELLVDTKPIARDLDKCKNFVNLITNFRLVTTQYQKDLKAKEHAPFLNFLEVVKSICIAWGQEMTKRKLVDDQLTTMCLVVKVVVDAWASHVVTDSMRRFAEIEVSGDEIDARRHLKP